MNHRRLRKRGEKFVRRVRRESYGVRRARMIARRNPMEAVVELMEVTVGVPGLVKVKNVDGVAELRLDPVDVVAEPVVR